MTMTADGPMLWYPDRKGFLVGKILSGPLLATLEPPKDHMPGVPTSALPTHPAAG